MTRVASGALLVALLLLTIWWLPWWATAALGLITAVRGGIELAGLAAHAGAGVPRVFAGASTGVMTLAVLFSDPRAPFFVDDLLIATLAALPIAAGVVALTAPPQGQATFARAGTLALAPVYVGMPIGVLVWLQAIAGPATLTWLLAVIAVSDSAQFYAGRLAGRRPLAPIISPKKTVEGAIGGLLAAGAAGILAARFLLPAIPWWSAGIIALILAAAGMAGDLFESLLKRSAGAKDSASLIPGHGGVLDRVDSYLFAAPLYYLLLSLVVSKG
jgi:phosphatidate cytidylyltransferase